VRAVVPGALAGERLDRALATLLGATRARATALIAAGVVAVDGTVVTKGSTKVAAGAGITCPDEMPPAAGRPAPDESVAVTVVHEDDAVIVVDKPAGLVVHPGAGNATATLVHGLLAGHPELAGVGAADRPGIVHRLDKDTSGLLVVARTAGAYESLVGQLRRRIVTRRYLALVWGRLDPGRGVIDAPIGRSERTPTKMTVTARGRAARTAYEVIASSSRPADVSLVECTLDTGRTHQIRVHLAAIGHPVVGDARYGGRRGPAGDLRRFFLHAAFLAFDQPLTGERVSFTSPLPADLVAVLRRFGLSPEAARAARPEPSRPRRGA